MIVTPFSTAADGCNRENALLDGSRPALLLWRAEEKALVLPSALARREVMQRPLQDIAAAGLSVVTRGSGGGIVPQGPSTLNLAMVLPCPPDFTMQDGYRLICGAVAEALNRFEVDTEVGPCPGSFCDGTWNLLAQGRKLAGTAQRWRATPQGRVALLHVAILMQMPEPAHWAGLELLHHAAFSGGPPLSKHAHIPLDTLMPRGMSQNSFPGALARAAEDRLSAFTPGEERAA